MLDPTYQLVAAAVGRRLTRASRIVFEFRGALPDPDSGDLEMVFEGEHILRLFGSGDGERMEATSSAWVDHFAPPLSAENAKFVAECGKWVRRDTSLVPPALPLGDILIAFRPVKNAFTTLSGVRLEFSTRAMYFFVYCDESFVVGQADPRFAEWGFSEA